MDIKKISSLLSNENNQTMISSYFLLGNHRYCIHCMDKPIVIQKTVKVFDDHDQFHTTHYPTVGYACSCDMAINEIAESIAVSLYNNQISFSSPLEKINLKDRLEKSIPKEFYLKALSKIRNEDLPLHGHVEDDMSRGYHIPKIFTPSEIDLKLFKESMNIDIALYLHDTDEYYADKPIKILAKLVNEKLTEIIKEQNESIQKMQEQLNSLKSNFEDFYPKK